VGEQSFTSLHQQLLAYDVIVSFCSSTFDLIFGLSLKQPALALIVASSFCHGLILDSLALFNLTVNSKKT